MLRLQQELNDDTNGKGWEKGITKNGKVIDWRRCIYLEAAELIESYPWKHWKNIAAEADYENIRIETVDIWHFIMSEALRLEKLERDGDIADLVQTIESLEAYIRFRDGDRADTGGDIYAEMALVERLIEGIFCDRRIERLMSDFFDMASVSGLNLESLYTLYIGKNVLNRFRQNHGYKEGEYLKIWNGREDNVLMQEILASNSGISPEALYEALEEIYGTLQS
jgi:dimeric dUTPase (all-alpha-NTP-PPase superfamily)